MAKNKISSWKNNYTILDMTCVSPKTFPFQGITPYQKGFFQNHLSLWQSNNLKYLFCDIYNQLLHKTYFYCAQCKYVYGFLCILWWTQMGQVCISISRRDTALEHYGENAKIYWIKSNYHALNAYNIYTFRLWDKMWAPHIASW